MVDHKDFLHLRLWLCTQHVVAKDLVLYTRLLESYPAATGRWTMFTMYGWLYSEAVAFAQVTNVQVDES